jgi:hypothetical protein
MSHVGAGMYTAAVTRGTKVALSMATSSYQRDHLSPKDFLTGGCPLRGS